MGKTETPNGAFGKSDIEGKAAMVAASELGSERVSNGREHMSQRGQRASFNGANGMSDMEGKVTRVGASERGQRASFNLVLEVLKAKVVTSPVVRITIATR